MFSPIEQASWGGFLSTYSRINRQIEEDLQENARISHAEFEVLLRLSWQEGYRLRLQDLAAQSILTRSGVSRLVERLERAGFVVREEASEDRRGAYAVLTEAGAERFQVAVKAHVQLVHRVFLDIFTPEELQQMAEFWQRLER